MFSPSNDDNTKGNLCLLETMQIMHCEICNSISIRIHLVFTFFQELKFGSEQ